MPQSGGILYDLQNFLLIRRPICAGAFAGSSGRRGAVQGFSPRSGARMRRYLRTCQANYITLITLTYPAAFPGDGRTIKRHLDTLIKRLFRRSDIGEDPSVFWFVEFQERGAPHFHLFATFRLPYEVLAMDWFVIVSSDDERHLSAGTRIESLKSGRSGTCAYATKYAAKLEQKSVPEKFINVGRFWGIYGNRRCLAATIYFPFELLESAIFYDFRNQLRELLKRYADKVKKTWHRGPTSMVIVQGEEISGQIKLLMLRVGMTIGAATGNFRLIEHPTLDILPECV